MRLSGVFCRDVPSGEVVDAVRHILPVDVGARNVEVRAVRERIEVAQRELIALDLLIVGVTQGPIVTESLPVAFTLDVARRHLELTPSHIDVGAEHEPMGVEARRVLFVGRAPRPLDGRADLADARHAVTVLVARVDADHPEIVRAADVVGHPVVAAVAGGPGRLSILREHAVDGRNEAKAARTVRDARRGIAVLVGRADGVVHIDPVRSLQMHLEARHAGRRIGDAVVDAGTHGAREHLSRLSFLPGDAERGDAAGENAARIARHEAGRAADLEVAPTRFEPDNGIAVEEAVFVAQRTRVRIETGLNVEVDLEVRRDFFLAAQTEARAVDLPGIHFEGILVPVAGVLDALVDDAVDGNVGRLRAGGEEQRCQHSPCEGLHDGLMGMVHGLLLIGIHCGFGLHRARLSRFPVRLTSTLNGHNCVQNRTDHKVDLRRVQIKF